MTTIAEAPNSSTSSTTSPLSSFQRSSLTTLIPPLQSLTSFSSSSSTSPATTKTPLLVSTSSVDQTVPTHDFYIVLPDQDFTEKTGGIVKRGIIRSESLKGKFHRKLGSVEVLRHSEALNDEWIRKLYPGPREHMIYRKHPYDKELRYIGADIFHATLMDEMQNELSQIFRTLGAKTVTWEGHPLMNIVYDAPSSMAPFIPPINDHIFLPHMPSWKEMVKERLNEVIERYVFQFTYLDDFNVNDNLITRVLGKMNLSSQERHELFTQHQERHSITSSGHNRNLLSTSVSTLASSSTSAVSQGGAHDQLGLFSPVRITIRIEFFSLLDYMTYNKAWIESNWTIFHVSTFLRLINFRELEDLFIENNIDGRSLLQLALPVDLIQLPKIKDFLLKLSLPEEKFRIFRSKIQKLGSIDHLEFLLEVTQEEFRVRAEHERKMELMVSSRNQFRQQQQQQPSQPSLQTQQTQQNSTNSIQTQRGSRKNGTQPPSTPEPTHPTAVSTPATAVYKFSNLASPGSSKKLDPSASNQTTPRLNYNQEDHPPGDGSCVDDKKNLPPASPHSSSPSRKHSPRVTRADTLFSEGIFEVVMVGEGAVGKTSIMNRIVKDEFHSIETPTIGTKLMQHALGKLVLDIWDTGGQPAQHATMKARAKRADVILAIYDVSNRDSLIALKDILEDLFEIGIQPWTAVVLIGNKADVAAPLRQISLEEGLVTARDVGCSSFFETSAKTGYNIKEALSNAVLKCEQGRLDYLVNQPRHSEGTSIRLNHEYLSGEGRRKSTSSCAC